MSILFFTFIRQMNGSASSASSGRSMEELAAAAQLQHASGGYPPGGGPFLGGLVPGGGYPAAAAMMAPHDSLSQLQGQMSEGQASALRQMELDNARLRASLPGHGGHLGAFGGYVPAAAVGPGAARLPLDYRGSELHQLWKQDMLLREAAMMRGQGSRDLILEQMAAAEAAGSRGTSVFSGVGHAHGDGPSSRDNLAELYSMIRQSQVDSLASGEQGRRRPSDAAAVGRSMLGHTLEVATKLPSEDRGGAKQNDGSTQVTDDAPPANKLVKKKRSDSCSSFDALLTVFGDELAQFDKEEKEKLANKLAAGKANGGEKSKKKKGQKKGQKKRKGAGDKGAAPSPDRGSPVRPIKKHKRSRHGNGAAANPTAATPSGSPRPQEGRDGVSRWPSAGSTLFTVDINKPPSRPPSNFSVGMHSTSMSDLGGSMHHMGGGMAGQFSHLHAGHDPAVASMMLANLRSREAAAAAREAAILREMQARGAADLHHRKAHGRPGAAAGLHYHQLLLQQQQNQLGGYGGLVVPPVLGGYHGGGIAHPADAATYRGYPADAAPSLSVLHAPPDPNRPDPTREWMLATLQNLGRRRCEDDVGAGSKSGKREKLEVHHHAAEVEDEEEEEEEEEDSDPPEVQLQKFLDEFGDDAVKSRERFLKAVDDTEKSQADLHEWDRSRGLRKCHSRTVVKTRGSRACLVAFLNGKVQPRKTKPRVQKRK